MLVLNYHTWADRNYFIFYILWLFYTIEIFLFLLIEIFLSWLSPFTSNYFDITIFVYFAMIGSDFKGCSGQCGPWPKTLFADYIIDAYLYALTHKGISVYHYICVFVCVTVYHCGYPSLCLSVSLSFCLSVYHYVCLSVCLFVYHYPVSLPVCL